MPGMNGLELAKKLKSSFSGLKLLILNMYGDERFIEEFKKVGVKGYVFKTADRNELIKAINAVVNSGTYFDPKLRYPNVMTFSPMTTFLPYICLAD